MNNLEYMLQIASLVPLLYFGFNAYRTIGANKSKIENIEAELKNVRSDISDIKSDLSELKGAMSTLIAIVKNDKIA